MTAPWPYTFPDRAAETLLGAPREVRIPRNGDRDLSFTGWCLGHAAGRKSTAPETSGMDVDIYLTVGKRLVAHVCQWSLREGAGLAEDHRVAALESPSQAGQCRPARLPLQASLGASVRHVAGAAQRGRRARGVTVASTLLPTHHNY